MDNNPVENIIRLLTLNRKNSLFAGPDESAQNWARLASLIGNWTSRKTSRFRPGFDSIAVLICMETVDAGTGGIWDIDERYARLSEAGWRPTANSTASSPSPT
jgi:hypothetical protein